MSDAKRETERGGGEEKGTPERGSSKINPNLFVKKEVVMVPVPEEPIEEGYEYPELQEPEEDEGCVLFIGTEEENAKEEPEESQTSQDALLAAWWNYKRTTKLNKKKKKKPMTIYRDENYWNDGRYTDDEDFNPADS